MKLAPELLAIRNSLMLHLAFDLGVSASNVCQMPLDKLNEILVDNTAYKGYIDFIIGQESLLAFASPRDITKPISKRAVELVLEKAKGQEKPTEMVKVENIPYKSIKIMTLDEELEYRLSETDLDTFLIGCGYQAKPLTKRQLNSKSRGFSKSISGVLYVIKFIEINIEVPPEEGEEHEPPFEFIKYGITNEVDVDKRTKEQVRSAKRNGIKYETELLFLTKRLHGELIAELETKIDSVTRAFYKVPKSMMPDGHSETTSIDKLPDILDIIYDYLNPEYLNK